MNWALADVVPDFLQAQVHPVSLTLPTLSSSIAVWLVGLRIRIEGVNRDSGLLVLLGNSVIVFLLYVRPVL